jgi:tetratricopeptide (TPR) repeat protein
MIWVVSGLVLVITAYSVWKMWQERKKLIEEADRKVALPDFTEMPMLERDYLMRFFTAFAKALAEAISRRKDRSYEEALKALEDGFAEDREAQALVDLPLNQFIDKVDVMEEFDASKWSFAAEMLYERGLNFDAMNRIPESQEAYLKAFHLVLESLLSDPETYRQSSIDLLTRLKQQFSPEDLPVSTQGRLKEYEGLGN